MGKEEKKTKERILEFKVAPPNQIKKIDVELQKTEPPSQLMMSDIKKGKTEPPPQFKINNEPTEIKRTKKGSVNSSWDLSPC
jgi:hypothetical protein